MSAQGDGEDSQAIKTIIKGHNNTIAVLGGKTFLKRSEICLKWEINQFFFNFPLCNFLKNG